jgi:hypothetical protein
VYAEPRAALGMTAMPRGAVMRPQRTRRQNSVQIPVSLQMAPWRWGDMLDPRRGTHGIGGADRPETAARSDRGADLHATSASSPRAAGSACPRRGDDGCRRDGRWAGHASARRAHCQGIGGRHHRRATNCAPSAARRQSVLIRWDGTLTLHAAGDERASGQSASGGHFGAGGNTEPASGGRFVRGMVSRGYRPAHYPGQTGGADS